MFSSSSYISLGFVHGWEYWTRWPENLWPISTNLLSFTLLLINAILLFILAARAINCLLFQDSDSDAPLDKAGFFSIATFWWVVNPTLLTAQKRTLEIEDLPKLASADQPDKLSARFSRFRITEGYGAWLLLLRLYFSIQPGVFLWSFFSGWLFLAAMFLDPTLLRLLLSSSSGAPTPSAGGNRTAAPGGAPPAPSWEADLAYRLSLILLLSLSMLVRVTFMEQVPSPIPLNNQKGPGRAGAGFRHGSR